MSAGYVESLRPCADGNCPQMGRHRPCLAVRVHHGHTPALLNFDMLFCDHHMSVMTIDNFMTDEGWERICAAIRGVGRAVPRRELTTLVWVTCDEPKGGAS